jgi:hypothetical protein
VPTGTPPLYWQDVGGLQHPDCRIYKYMIQSSSVLSG